jgi:hypothetical protein
MAPGASQVGGDASFGQTGRPEGACPVAVDLLEDVGEKASIVTGSFRSRQQTSACRLWALEHPLELGRAPRGRVSEPLAAPLELLASVVDPPLDVATNFLGRRTDLVWLVLNVLAGAGNGARDRVMAAASQHGQAPEQPSHQVGGPPSRAAGRGPTPASRLAGDCGVGAECVPRDASLSW